MNRSALRQLFPICLIACASGCQREAEPTPEASAAIETPAAAVPTATTSEHKQTPEPELADPKEKASAAAVAEFTPPFPDRLELFETPKRTQSNIRRDDEHGETVELKGFINVDQPRVVLSIDGQISPVAEGGEKYGVKVITIQPPSVVLQRGRNRWTATLE